MPCITLVVDVADVPICPPLPPDRVYVILSNTISLSPLIEYM